MNMNKQQIIQELQEVIATLKLDRRKEVDGFICKIGNYKWKIKYLNLDTNLFIDWVKK